MLDIILFAAGFGVCWYCKDPVLRLVTGIDALIKSVGAKFAVLRGKS
ncbi:hypothetical protein [Bradyrhizobium amphicarpaeae]|nr:hypothetical protein [Bradyrhizobium amphicarpaeae]